MIRCPTASPIPRPARAFRDRLVEDPPRLLGHPELTFVDRRVHVLARPARERQLEVVDDTGPVHGQRADHAPFHQVDQDRREPDFDRVAAHPHGDDLPVARGRGHGADSLRGSSLRRECQGANGETRGRNGPARADA